MEAPPQYHQPTDRPLSVNHVPPPTGANLTPKYSHAGLERRRNSRIMVVLVIFLIVGAIVGGTLGKFFGDHGPGRNASVGDGSGVTGSDTGGGASSAGTSVGGLPGNSITVHSPSSTSSDSTPNPTDAMYGDAVADYTYSYPTAIAPAPSTIQVFSVPSPAGPLYVLTHNISTDPKGYNWTNLYGGVSSPIVAANSIDLGYPNANAFVRGMDGAMYHKYESDSLVSWGPGAADYDGRGGYLYSPPSVASWSANRVDTFVTGGGDALYSMMWNGGGGWGGWVELGGTWASYAPTPVSWGKGRLDVFVVGFPDNSLYHMWLVPGSDVWQPQGSFENLGGNLAGRPVAVAPGDGRLDVFVRGGDAGLWHLEYSGGNWKQWARINGTVIQAEPEAVSSGVDQIDVFVLTAVGRYERRSLEGGRWAPPEDLGGSFGGPPKAVVTEDSHVHVYGYSGNGDLMHRSWDRRSNVWSPGSSFENLGKPS